MVIIDASPVLGRHPGATPAPWFALWLDTQYPGELVVRPGSGPRPLVTFRTMGGPLSIHIQVGNTWKENFDASSALCRWEPAWRSWF